MTTYTHADFKAASIAWADVRKVISPITTPAYDYVITFALRAMGDEGWKLVPKEPTERMEEAGNIDYGCACWLSYKPMLEAAPEYTEGKDV